ncbi:MAG: biotin carboxylase N-terminal domain-containing protein [Alphaproteobacteria bacterium]|nr:biotin carboxylase N-terminal domain-containing protein [Alphaproteobacteria bacterium]
MIRSVLIANRGEIACRVIRTARRLGMRTIAVFSEADRDSLAVAMADVAYPIGPAPARDSYLRHDRIVAVAKASGADAIHPGYGFLSENAEFAEACAAAGVIFIGPPASAIRAMGSKSASKQLMERAGVPLVPGYHGDDQDPALLAAEAERIGYPVLIKASAGGGGKGMRVVTAPAEFAEQLAGAQREAQASFGDPKVLVEKYLQRPRHIEMQVFADTHGSIVHLFERDCSIQRRHQKVFEEAPAPGFSAAARAAMASAATDAARAVGYVGAGTVEFIAEGDAFYFMEMNTRLQVEHPVTEAITGFDLVEWQLRVAAGERLPADQSAIHATGAAIEVRLYAEDAGRGFLPQSGRLDHLVLPEGEGVRVDAGVRAGDVVSIHYDPMIAKIIAWGADRGEALQRLVRALDATEVAGLTTNLPLLQAVARHPEFAAGKVDTGFIARHADAVVPQVDPAGPAALALATLAVILEEQAEAVGRAQATPDPWSPWSLATGFRINRPALTDHRFRDGDRVIDVGCRFLGPARFQLTFDGLELEAEAAMLPDGSLSARLDGVHCRARVVRMGERLTVFQAGRATVLVELDRLAGVTGAEGVVGRLTSPMPGRVLAVRVAVGDTVAKGVTLMVVEAMKMEHAILAPADGVVASIAYAAGDTVQEGAELLVLEPLGT